MRTMAAPEGAKYFWNEFLRKNPALSGESFYDCFHFDVGEVVSNKLLNLMLERRRTATASLGWLMEANERPLPTVGSLRVVTNWNKVERRVIRITSVLTLPFCEVPESLARAEGEGDGTLEYWRKVHWGYFSRLCDHIDREPTNRMPVVRQEFELVYSNQGADAT